MKKDPVNSSAPFYGYDPVKDIAPVDQLGFVDLRNAFVNNTIPGDLACSDESFNGVEDPSSLLGKSSDVFDAYRKASYVRGAEASAAAAKAAAASSAASE